MQIRASRIFSRMIATGGLLYNTKGPQTGGGAPTSKLSFPLCRLYLSLYFMQQEIGASSLLPGCPAPMPVVAPS